MRSREAKLALTGRYEEAVNAKEVADDREEAELDVGGEREQAEFLALRKKLLGKQERDMRVFAERANVARLSLITKRDRKIGGYIRRMNRINRELDDRLEVLGIDEAEVCDPEPDKERGDFAYETEMALPIPEFRRTRTSSSNARMSADDASNSR
jgi:hypothetical protein